MGVCASLCLHTLDENVAAFYGTYTLTVTQPNIKVQITFKTLVNSTSDFSFFFANHC